LTKGVAYDRTTRLNYTSSEYSKRKDTADYWNNNREVLMSNFYRELFLQAASHFKSIPERYTDPKSKTDMNLRSAAYYNLCKIYLFLDEPENVAEYADLIFANGIDTKSGYLFFRRRN
jgi:hypothetical protein